MKRKLSKRPQGKNRKSFKELLLLGLGITGILFSPIVMVVSFWFGLFMLVMSGILLPPFIKAISSKTHLRIRYILIILSFIAFTGLTYAANSYTNSDEFKEVESQIEEENKLEQERVKRERAELAQRQAEEEAKKEKEAKEALEKMISEAQAINSEYPEEKDEETTSVEKAKEANLKIANELETTDKKTNETKTLTKLLNVIEVIDGDTIKVSELGTLRLIGIDTPETVDPRKSVQCFGKEASDMAKSLLKGKKVRLEFDNSQGRLDKYGRTLAYVYREDGLFFNKEMIEKGYAHEYTYSTPYKYQNEFKKTQKEAQNSKKGLWSGACECKDGEEVSKSCTSCNQLTIIKKRWDCSTYKEKVSSSSCSYKCSTAPKPVAPSPSPYGCNCKKTCTQMSSCAEAQYQLKTCGCQARDADKDGIACDAQCQ